MLTTDALFNETEEEEADEVLYCGGGAYGRPEGGAEEGETIPLETYVRSTEEDPEGAAPRPSLVRQHQLSPEEATALLGATSDGDEDK